jgi:hypothetical protein
MHRSAAVPTCQFPVPSLSHQEKPGVQSYANRSASGGMPLLITCRLALARSRAQPGQGEPRPVDVRQDLSEARPSETAAVAAAVRTNRQHDSLGLERGLVTPGQTETGVVLMSPSGAIRDNERESAPATDAGPATYRRSSTPFQQDSLCYRR